MKYKETAEDVVNAVIDLVNHRGSTLLSASLSQHYKTITYELTARNGNKFKITNNDLNYNFYNNKSKFEKQLKLDLKYETIFKDFKKSLNKTTSMEVDAHLRNYTILPAGWYRFDTDTEEKYSLYKDVKTYDINKCYTAALSGRSLYDLDYNSLKTLKSPESAKKHLKTHRGVLLMSFTANYLSDKDRSLFPISQPGLKDGFGFYDMTHSGNVIKTDFDNAFQEIKLVSFNNGTDIFDEWTYFNKKYDYFDLKFQEISFIPFKDEVLFPNEFKESIDLLYDEIGDIPNSQYKRKIKVFASMIVGKLFQKLEVEETEGSYYYELKDPSDMTSFRLTQKESGKRKLNKTNNISYVVYAYALINKYIRDLFSHVSFKDVLKISADSVTVKSDVDTHYFDSLLGKHVGDLKVETADNFQIHSSRQYVGYNDDKTIQWFAIGGLSNRIKPYLKTTEDWDNRFELNKEHAPKTFDELFNFEIYNEKMSKAENHNYYDYPIFNQEVTGPFTILAPQGTGKTTSIVKKLKGPRKFILHLFYNKKPQYENYLEHDDGYYKIRTIDSLIQEIYQRNVKNRRRQRHETYRRWILDNVEYLTEYLDEWDNIVIDEIQSLSGSLTSIAQVIIRNYSDKLICAGDFNQQFEKIHRGDKPFLLEYLPKNEIYTLDVNFRNSKAIQDYADSFLHINTTCGSDLEGSVEFRTIENYDEMIKELNELSEDFHFINRTEHQRRKLRQHGLKHRIYSVSQSLSLSPNTVVMVNSSKVGVMEDRDEAVKEIMCSVLRAKERVIIYENN